MTIWIVGVSLIVAVYAVWFGLWLRLRTHEPVRVVPHVCWADCTSAIHYEPQS